MRARGRRREGERKPGLGRWGREGRGSRKVGGEGNNGTLTEGKMSW